MVTGTNLRCAGESHPGLVRSNNEDRFYADPERGIFLVVDGVGGQAAGEKAADVAVETVRKRLERQTGSAAERVREAIAVANNEILRLARSNPQWKGMACVLTAAVVEEGGATVGHVGDSRLYKIRGGAIRKVTHDHSPVGEREDSRALSEAEAMRHPRRNEVYRDVGSEEHTPDDPDFIEVADIPFEPDAALLLCSDGLSDQVTSGEILRIVEREAGNPQAAARALVAAANHAGGKDNVSVVIVEGPEFRAAAISHEPARRVRWFNGRAAWALYGFAAAALLAGAVWRLRPAPPAVPQAPRTLVVGTEPGAQFTAINDALAQARAGDTIELLAGEYREQIRMREGVTIASRTPRTAILRAAPLGTGPQPGVIAERINAGRLAGLRIVADESMPLSAGVEIANAGIEVDDCEISGAGVGIAIR